MKVLLTGFEPFGKYQVNSSWETVKQFENAEFPDTEIIVRQIPVSYKRAKEYFKQLLAEIRPDAVIMTGQAVTRSKISMERIAINLMDGKTPDNDGYQPEDTPIYPDGEIAYYSNMPIKAFCEKMKELNIPAKISNSAGLFVCNTVMYEVLRETKTLYPDMLAGFIHFPVLEEFKEYYPISKTVPASHAYEAVKQLILLINK